MANPYWENVCDIAERQREKGVATYGKGIEMNPADIVTRIAYLQEELVDALMYCEWIKSHIIGADGEEGEPMIKDCDNCAHKRVNGYNPCDNCVVSCVEGKRTSDPSHWKKKIEVIHCKDCQSHEPCEVRNRVWCSKMGRYMKEDGFCSEGKVKDNG
jgi:hypothetical protein